MIGIDFGTLSARALLLEAVTGQEVVQAVCSYNHGVITGQLHGTAIPDQYALQDPQDYLRALGSVVREVLRTSGVGPEKIEGLCLDFTTCTLLALDDAGVPLCFDPEFSAEPHAYAKLWKHHGAVEQTKQLNEAAEVYAKDMLRRYGGKLSCEWAIPKIAEVLRCAPHIYHRTARFAEAGDWLTWWITGKEVHSASFAGYKACYDHQTGYPGSDFLAAFDPALADLIGTKIADHVGAVCSLHARIDSRGAEITGLLPGTAVAVPMPDAHVAMPALNITDSGTMMLILGTSACHLIHANAFREVSGICGCIQDGVIPGLYTYEAGQASCGDMLQWCVERIASAEDWQLAERTGLSLHQIYTRRAEKLRPGETGLLALDWPNGNRSTLIDADLSGLLIGWTLETRPEEIYRTLIEAIAFGTRRIIEIFEENHVSVDQIVAAGGISGKNPLMMQILADVTGKEIRIAGSEQASARGSAIYAAVACGIYPDIKHAAQSLAVPDRGAFYPIAENQEVYTRMYGLYLQLHDYFGKNKAVMHTLRTMKNTKLRC